MLRSQALGTFGGHVWRKIQVVFFFKTTFSRPEFYADSISEVPGSKKNKSIKKYGGVYPLSPTKVRGIACEKNALAKPGKISLNKHIAIGANMCQNNSYMFVSRNFDWFGQRISFTGVPIFFTNWLQKIYPALIALSCSLEQSKCIKLYTIVFVTSQGFHRYPISIGFHVKRSGQDQFK